MKTKEYRERFDALKLEQSEWVKKYNSSKIKEKKKEYYKHIMVYEKELFALELERRKND